jgi:cis-3-alkyl-4-acyloxetan-2-one decarboxylase
MNIVANEAQGVVTVDGIEVLLDGDAEHTVVMIHGWPDTHRLWDSTVAHLKGRHRCVRFTLPGFDVAQPPRPTSMAQMTALFKAVVDRVSPDRPVTLLLHDWGCVFGYEFAARHPDRVARVVGVDIGDHNSGAYLRSLPAKAKFQVAFYQLWLALAWKLGGSLGDRMSRWMARAIGCRTDPARIGWRQNYPYAMQWFGTAGGFRGAARVDLPCPMLYVYGQRKLFMFHSPRWLEALAARAGCAVHALPTGHWVMAQQPDAFNRVVGEWLDSPLPAA